MDLSGWIAQFRAKEFGLGLSGPNMHFKLSRPNWLGPLVSRVRLGHSLAYVLGLSLVIILNSFGLAQ